jgi:hypothetical protein
MMREWRRLYRLRGYTPFGVLLIVLLAVLVVSDRVTERWSAAAQRRDAMERQVAAMRATVERSRKIDASLESARGRLAAVAGRVATASDAKAAGDILAQASERWVVSMGATGGGKGAKGLDRGQSAALDAASTAASSAAVGVAAAEVAVRVLPQQLLRILGQWGEAPLAMRLVRLEVTVDNPDAPTALEAILRVEGVYQPAQAGGLRAASPATTASRGTRSTFEPRPAKEAR